MPVFPVCSKVPLPLSTWQGVLITAALATYDAVMIWVLSRLIRNAMPSRLTDFLVRLAASLPRPISRIFWWIGDMAREHRSTTTFVVTLVFVSPVPVIASAWALEGPAPWYLMDPSRQSWSFPADVALAALLGLCAHGWVALPYEVRERYRKSWWLALSAVLGVAMAMLFHLHEAGAYDLLRYYSIPKLIHDLVSYVVLATMVIYGAWPVLRHKARPVARRGPTLPARALVTLTLAVWLLGAVHDAVWPPNPAYLHVKNPSVATMGVRGPVRDPLAENACRTS